jgi:hypothetical protein
MKPLSTAARIATMPIAMHCGARDGAAELARRKIPVGATTRSSPR